MYKIIIENALQKMYRNVESRQASRATVKEQKASELGNKSITVVELDDNGKEIGTIYYTERTGKGKWSTPIINKLYR